MEMNMYDSMSYFLSGLIRRFGSQSTILLHNGLVLGIVGLFVGYLFIVMDMDWLVGYVIYVDN